MIPCRLLIAPVTGVIVLVGAAGWLPGPSRQQPSPAPRRQTAPAIQGGSESPLPPPAEGSRLDADGRHDHPPRTGARPAEPTGGGSDVAGAMRRLDESEGLARIREGGRTLPRLADAAPGPVSHRAESLLTDGLEECVVWDEESGGELLSIDEPTFEAMVALFETLARHDPPASIRVLDRHGETIRDPLVRALADRRFLDGDLASLADWASAIDDADARALARWRTAENLASAGAARAEMVVVLSNFGLTTPMQADHLARVSIARWQARRPVDGNR